MGTHGKNGSPAPAPVRPLVINPLSDNVGGVKLFLSTLPRALREERHFGLAEEVLFQPRLAS